LYYKLCLSFYNRIDILAFKFAINQEILSTWKLINLEYFADMNNEKKLKKLKAGLLLLSRDREVVYSFHETFDLVDELIEIVDELLEKD
jgi:hypothetical protein|tara:strand:- start:8561 stop:8827 length:267 start_codon:yes stop_codon:yes gene_type:complete